MSYKNALAGLDHGGGKAVIIGDPRTDKTEALLRAYGRFVESLGGRYLTACDVGTYVADMDVVARETRLRHRPLARPRRRRATPRCSPPTASSRACGPRPSTSGARRRWPGARVGVAGVGKVGPHLVAHLLEDGADGRGHRRRPGGASPRSRTASPAGAGRSPTPTTLVRADLDVYSPCALGGALDDDTVAGR